MQSITAASASVPAAVDDCARNFVSLADNLRKSAIFAEQVTSEAVLDEFDRFKLWAGNIAAHRKGHRSLEHRLRNAPQLQAKTVDMLTTLSRGLRDAMDIVEGKRLPWDEEIYSDSESSLSEDDSVPNLQGDTELKQLYVRTKSIITSLMRLSLAIREPVPDAQVRIIDKSHFEHHDMEHVQAKFPAAPQYLIERLGRAITFRRQYLTYREMHHNKLTKDIEKLGFETARTDFTSNSTEATVLQNPESIGLMRDIDGSDDNASMTSYATSVNATLRAPKLPKRAIDMDHYSCPLCFGLVSIHTAEAWKRHVFQDLHPYCCTFENCTTADRLYDSRHAWFTHELQAHHTTLECVEGCSMHFPTELDFERHIKSRHAELATPRILSVLLRTSLKCSALIELENCRLCDKRMTLRMMTKHLGHHLEELALFALPTNATDSESDLDEGEIDSPVVESSLRYGEDGSVLTDTSDESSSEPGIDIGVQENYSVPPEKGHPVPSDNSDYNVAQTSSISPTPAPLVSNPPSPPTAPAPLDIHAELRPSLEELADLMSEVRAKRQARKEEAEARNAAELQQEAGVKAYDQAAIDAAQIAAQVEKADDEDKLENLRLALKEVQMAGEAAAGSDHPNALSYAADAGAAAVAEILLAAAAEEELLLEAARVKLEAAENETTSQADNMRIAHDKSPTEAKDAADELARGGLHADLDAYKVLPEDLPKEPIKFKDAVGRKFSFPWHLCKTWTGMEGLIKQAFLHVDIIGPHVDQGHYDIVGPDKEVILPQVWDTVVQPGWTITMHMWPMPEPKDDRSPPSLPWQPFQMGIKRRIEPVLRKPPRPGPQPTYAKVQRAHLDVETLHHYDIPYEDDVDPSYIIVLREMSQEEMDILFEHTRRFRETHGERVLIEAEENSVRRKREHAPMRKKKRKGVESIQGQQ